MDRRRVAEVLRRIAGPITDLVLLGEGHFTAAWLVNRTVVYRFAKHEAAALSLRREACLLPQLAPHLPLKIPQPKYYEISLDPLVAIGAHDLIAGKPLTRRRFAAFGGRRQDSCAARLAQFLMTLHQTDLDLARQCCIEVRDYRSHYADLAMRFEQHMARHAGEGGCRYIRAVFDGFLTKEAAELGRSALLHGDLSCPHILCDRPRGNVTAIIDFGDMVIADPASDLAGLYENYGAQFMRHLLRHMPCADVEARLRRIYRLYELGWIEWAVDIFEERRREDIALVRSELQRLQRNAPRQIWRAMLPR